MRKFGPSPLRARSAACRDVLGALALTSMLAACRAPEPPLVAVGVEHACGLWPGRGLACWGRDQHGQRGEGLDALGGVVSVAAGGSTTCVVTDAGEVFCFGHAHRAQLGDGSRESSARPRRVMGLPPAVGVSVGFAHACAWTEDGEVCCWGWNGSGQADPDRAGEDVLVPVCRALGARRVVAGFDATCTLDGRERASCFGGIALEADGARAVALGADHACVLGGSTLECFGATPGGEGEPPRSFAIEGGAVAAGAVDHVCVTDRRGRLFCLGKNDGGQLGDGTLVGRRTLVAVRGLDEPVSSAGTGDRYTCAVAGGRIWCWGWNEHGQLGHTGIPSLDPVAVSEGAEERRP